ncbi:hypothetical protein CW704_03360 [Candidatus Bathyarchaeota archaeon]|nr:MAG: hypothetical protein CW704_03360 [Candidatus Bathyarchaeota archaeon]
MKLRLKSKEVGEEELPFAFMLITLMASCGISPYESFKRLRFVDLLPFVQKESNEIVRQVEVLNVDPLSAMQERAEQTESEAYGDFLRGYVSTVKSGGSVTSYLKSKLRSIFEVRAAAATRSIERLETLVEAYMAVLLVLLSVYILVAVVSSSSFTDALGFSFNGQILVYLVLFLFMPMVSIIFMAFAHLARKGTLMNIRSIYLKAIPFAIISSAVLAGTFIVPQVREIFVSSVLSLEKTIEAALPFIHIGSLLDYVVPIIMVMCLSLVSLYPMIEYTRIIKLNVKAEESMPSFLRDISENRKTGMSPEKSISQAATRRGYGSFTKILKRTVNQIEWGVSLRKIYMDLRDHLRSWPVLINFLILIETIEVGGGSPEALDLLAAYSEKIRDIEKNKREMLRPYVVLPFIWTILMALTFTFTFYVVTHLPIMHVSGPALPMIESQLALFSSAIVFHSWLSGFFIGKVAQGSFAAGFKYSILLAITALVSLLLSQNVIDLIMGLL